MERSGKALEHIFRTSFWIFLFSKYLASGSVDKDILNARARAPLPAG
jgi:hypothetical protein